MKRPLMAALLLACAGCLLENNMTGEPTVRYADTFDLSGSTCGFGLKTQANRSVVGTPLVVAGVKYARGIGAHPEGAVGFTANGKVTAFDALVGVDDSCLTAKHAKRTARLVFKVWADGRIVWSKTLVERERAVPVHVDLTGAKEIVLETSSSAPWVAFDAAHGDWLDARFTCAAGAKLEAINDPSLTVQLGILTPPEKLEPQFNGADIWGVRPGRPVIFRVPVSGERPMKFTASNLPAGVTLDPEKGVLRGTAPQKKGDYDITVVAENARGRAERVIRLAVGDTIALTPPMGWNSWNTLCYRLTADKAKAAALALEKSGLGDHGWAYVNLDDWWEMNNSDNERAKERPEVRGKARDDKGKIIPNPTFPDMKGLTDYIHSFGFKAGLYSSPGPQTCGGCEGSYGHELQDAESWADWGFDYIKYDWCSYGKMFKKETDWETWEWQHKGRETPADKLAKPAPATEAFVKPYRVMNECLKKQKRDIVYSYCQYGIGESHLWARANGANCWRSWEDLKDTWPWMERALEGQIGADEYYKYNGPGCWADPDMMIVGQQYSFGYDHPTFLTPNEQYTHVSLWCMVGSPLLIGCDLTTLDAFTRNLLANDDVISVSQDRLGKTARRIRHVDTESVWTRPLVNGAQAVALVNRYPFAREIRVSFVELGLGDGDWWVKDLWRQQCEGLHSESYVAVVPPHATKLLYMKPAGCRRCE